MKTRTFLILAVLLLALYQRQCTSRKLAEATFHKDAFVELKVVLRMEHLPLHYDGETVSIACRSSETRGFEAWKHDFVDAGWNIAPRARMRVRGRTLTPSIDEWAKAARDAYSVTDAMTVMAPSYTKLWITWNGCRTFTPWDVRTNFPQAFVVETNPAHQACLASAAEQKARGTPMAGDCYESRWRDDPLEFQALTAKRDGSASFQVRSSAFESRGAYTVSTATFGTQWQTTPPTGPPR